MISGYVFCIDGGAVSWNLRKQALVFLSTTESEFVVMIQHDKGGIVDPDVSGQDTMPSNETDATIL